MHSRKRRLVATVLITGSIVTACSSGSDTAKKRRPATTTTVRIPLAPLTGVPDPGGASLGRSALSVKIENTPEARPQSGLDLADVVYEEAVEGGITRFWGIFNSQVPPALVGPIRSVRAMDVDIVSALGGVVAFSGGTANNVALIRQAPVVTVSENNANDGRGQPNCDGDANAEFCRSSKRAAPHNLFGRAGLLFMRGGQPVPPAPLFTYLDPKAGQTFTGTPISEFKVNFASGYDVTYQWDATVGWKRVQGTEPFMSDNGQQIAVTNVVVQFTPYATGGEGQLIGEGDAWIFSNGQGILAHWAKASPTQPTQYTDAAGLPISLTPGRTWVELLPTGLTVDVTQAPPPPPTAATTTTTKPKRRR